MLEMTKKGKIIILIFSVLVLASIITAIVLTYGLNSDPFETFYGEWETVEKGIKGPDIKKYVFKEDGAVVVTLGEVYEDNFTQYNGTYTADTENKILTVKFEGIEQKFIYEFSEKKNIMTLTDTDYDTVSFKYIKVLESAEK